jgi:gamma-tubulin complex component 4
MVPEVLLALLGVPGEVIVLVPATATAPERFAVNPDLHILEPPERASLDRLVAIGYAFRELESFVQRENEAGALAAVGAETLGPRRGNDGSLYRRALASGVADVLTRYESAILKLEQDILRGIVPALPAALESTLCEFALVLPSLWAVIQPVADANTLKGAALLHHLRAASLAAGAPALENALRTLEARARRAAHQQLLAWTVHGRLVDPHGEFWVRPVAGAGGDGGVFLGEATDDENENENENENESGVRGAALETPGVSDSDDDDDDDARDAFSSSRRRRDGGEREWHRGFQVCLEALPPGVELPAAEAALFTGRAVRVLSNPRGAFKRRVRFSGLDDEESSRESSREHEESSLASAGASTSLLPDAALDAAAAQIRSLAVSDEAFDRARFEHVVERIRRPVADRLGRLVVVDAELPRHLRALRAYLLLGRGDFYQCFLEEARALLAAPPRASTAEADLAVPFAQAASKSSAADDAQKLARRFRLRLGSPYGADAEDAEEEQVSKKNRSRRRVPAYDAWDSLSLEYAVPWPLGLLLTRDALRRYDEMFKYLLRLRRAARALDEAWVALRRLAAAAATTTPGALRAEEEREARRRRRLRLHGADVGTAAPNAAEACQRARRDVAFLVRNWLTYLQTDVVEAQFREMMDAIDATTKDENGVDFGQAQRAHRAFLAALGAQSFLDLPSVTQSVEATLAMARTVCGAIATLPLDGSQGPDESRVAAEMERARQAVDATSRDLYDTLRSDRLAGDPKAPYLRRLLLRLNFNGFMGDKADAARRREKVAGPNAQVPDAGIGRDRKGSEGLGVSENTAPSAFAPSDPSDPLGSSGRRGWGASDPPTPGRS